MWEKQMSRSWGWRQWALPQESRCVKTLFINGQLSVPGPPPHRETCTRKLTPEITGVNGKPSVIRGDPHPPITISSTPPWSQHRTQGTPVCSGWRGGRGGGRWPWAWAVGNKSLWGPRLRCSHLIGYWNQITSWVPQHHFHGNRVVRQGGRVEGGSLTHGAAVLDGCGLSPDSHLE